MNELDHILLQDASLQNVFLESETNFINSQIYRSEESTEVNSKHFRSLFLLLNHTYSDKQETTNSEILNRAYILLKSINVENQEHLNMFNEILGMEGVDTKILYYFYLASVGLKSNKIINARIDLKEFENKTLKQSEWKHQVINDTLRAFILLVRKENGFSDIRDALKIISDLQTNQKEFEEKYLNQLSLKDETKTAYILLGLYHVTKPIVEVANYLINGYNYRQSLEPIIRQHINTARQLLKSDTRLTTIANITEENLNIIQANAIWSKTRFNDKIRQLCKVKSEQGWLELLPSQREALNKNLLDVASNVTVLQMPTSAGKTLLAEFNILVTKALRQDSKIVYVVPSRALVNQVYFDLKSDLEDLGLTIEKTSSAIEVDPAENSFLEDKIDVLVSTPEKLDLLIRRNHSSVEDVALFIFDEAHTIQNGQRGAKLELLLAILKRERPESKFMLLSPFMGESSKFVTEWLGGGNSIAVDWKPSEKLLVGISNHQTKKIDDIKYTILGSPWSLGSKEYQDKFPNPYKLKSSSPKDRILEFTANHFSKKDKTTLVLCKGRGTADKRAQFLSNNIDSQPPSEEIKLIKKYIEDEVGRTTTLSQVLEKRVAIHHAGLSDESKLLVEHLIRNKEIRHVCSTTTVAEGVNFPVSTVFFDAFHKGTKVKLDSNDFWNIAGRAGRTMVDNVGKIILPFNSKTNIENANSLLEKSSNELVSVLSELFVNGDKILDGLSSNGFSSLLYEYNNSLGPLVQYFVHLLTVGNNEYFSGQIEDLFKDTLEYYMLDSHDKREKFIQICKSIYLHLEEKYSKEKGVLSFADKTGFSVPSVLAVMSEKSNYPEISDPESWKPNSLFNIQSTENLTNKIEVIAKLKETKIGTDSDRAPFNAELIAKILISWVNGEKLYNISNSHPAFANIKDENQRVSDFIKKMNDIRFKTSWGLSALEGIAKGSFEDVKDSYVPSLVYFGVKSEKSLLFRMVGVPRALSNTLSKVLEKDVANYSFSDVRKTINGLSNNDWDSLRPKNSNLSGQEWKRISEILVK